jgi:hypothetical protein
MRIAAVRKLSGERMAYTNSSLIEKLHRQPASASKLVEQKQSAVRGFRTSWKCRLELKPMRSIGKIRAFNEKENHDFIS